MRLRRAKRLTVLAIVASLVCAAGAYAAVAGLPAGVQVNKTCLRSIRRRTRV